MAANPNPAWPHALVVPLVDGADWHVEKGCEALWAQVLVVGHELRVGHALCYCLAVPHKSEQRKASLLFTGLPADPGKGAPATVVHDDLPGWQVRLVLTQAGLVESICLEPRTTKGLLRRFPPGHPEALPDTTSPLPAGGVTSRLLRRLPLGEIVEAVRSDLRLTARTVRPHGRAGSLMAHNAEQFARRPGRAGRSDRDYAEVAAAYVAILATSDPKPVEMLAAQTFLSPSQIRNVLYEARRRELLTKAPPGRPGGQLTEKCRRILEEN